MSDEAKLKARVGELEETLRLKDRELQKYRTELTRTNQSLERVIAELSQELKWVSVIQKALSPTAIPNIPGFEFSSKFIPGSQSGGDYFDIFEHDDRLKFGVLMSSSSGYAMSALFLSVLLKLSGRIEAKKGTAPLQALELLASEMKANMQSKDEVQIFYGVVDRRTFDFRYSSLGEMASLLQPAGQDKIVRLAPGGPALKQDFSAKPLDQTIQLGPRDRLILCSEGVISAPNPAGETFGWDRLQEAILRGARSTQKSQAATSPSSVHDVRNEILFRLEQFTETSEPLRDLTVIVVEVNDRVIKLAK